MTETPDTSGNQPKADYRAIEQVVSGKSASTQASTPQVRTVPTRSVGGHVTLRYTPINERGQSDNSTGG